MVFLALLLLPKTFSAKELARDACRKILFYSPLSELFDVLSELQ